MTYTERTSEIRVQAQQDAKLGIDNSLNYRKAYKDECGISQRSERITYQMAHAQTKVTKDD